MRQSLALALVLGSLSAAALPAQPAVSGPFIVFIGLPGSGKSTQAAFASKKHGLPVLSVDELIRSNADLFRTLQATGLKGIEPQTDPVLNKLFEQRLAAGGFEKGLILDGYPATKDHGDFIAKLISAGRLPVPFVLQFEVSDDVARKRMKGLSSPDRLEQRIKDYHREMDMVRLYFPNAEIQKIDGSKSEGRVRSQVEKVLQARLKKE